ncbi:AP-2 complex subunit beta [Quaeritorhiza haematococci]|nr:AP-2 complex subunit beta [Quaeritorhiza haematococci]
MAAERRPRFFSTNKKGENFELKADLNSEYKEKRKETVKKVIANMTIGKDVSSLFADVVKNMQTEDLELKKLVYLYLMNYAKSQPELVILAVNTFVKDTDDANPLIRALAIRTMGCLRVEKIIDYLLEPLKKGLKDEDPYVRKTAAICVAKLFDLSPTMAIENGLVSILQDMLSDRNPMVIANAVAALAEISETSIRKDVFVVNNSILTKLLAALNECTEWGQICILTSLANYRPRDAREAGEIVERVIPRLQHANASVVLSAVKVLMIYMSFINNEELTKQIIKKMAPPLVTLLSSQPEIQYVALRNINLILQKRPDILSQEMRVFFTKYNDPPYVKLEKLEVIIKLCSEKNIDQVLSELKEYANEVDVDFVRKSVRAIGRCAIKIDSASERCVNVLLDLIKTKVNYLVQEAIVVIKDIFRKYPRKYEGIIPALCENLDVLDEPEAKASLIWIIGEYADRIENAEELLEHFAEGFKDENSQVQLQLLTATVKMFLKKPGTGQALVQQILQTGTQGVDNPDIRDRAYVYWRLLSSNPQAAKGVVLSEKPPIEVDNATVSETLLDELIQNIASLASVYHKSPALLGQTTMEIKKDEIEEEAEVLDFEADGGVAAIAGGGDSGAKIADLLDLDFGGDSSAGAAAISPSNATGGGGGGIDDLLGLVDMSGPSTSAVPPAASLGSGGNLLDGLGSLGGLSSPVSGAGAFGAATSPLGSSFGGLGAPSGSMFVFPKVPLLTAANAQGLDLSGTFSQKNGMPSLDMTFANRTGSPMSDFAIQFNVNTFGIAPAAPLQVPSPLAPNQSVDVSLPLNFSGGVQKMEPGNLLQVAVKNNVGVFYFQTFVPVHVLFVTDPTLGGGEAGFNSVWNDFTAQQASFSVQNLPSVSDFNGKLRRNNIYVVSQPNPSTFKVVAKTPNNLVLAAEINLQLPTAVVNAKSRSPEIAQLFQQSLDGIVRS